MIKNKSNQIKSNKKWKQSGKIQPFFLQLLTTSYASQYLLSTPKTQTKSLKKPRTKGQNSQINHKRTTKQVNGGQVERENDEKRNRGNHHLL